MNQLSTEESKRPNLGRGRFIYELGGIKRYDCSAEDIAIWLEDPQQRGGTIYRVHRAYPDGRMEIKGVSADRWQLESGLFFYRGNLPGARADFSALSQAGELAPPCRCFVHLADRLSADSVSRYVTALVFPSEFEDDIADWLLERNFAGGDFVEGGISHVTNYYADPKTVLDRAQLWRAGSTSQPVEQAVRAGQRRWA